MDANRSSYVKVGAIICCTWLALALFYSPIKSIHALNSDFSSIGNVEGIPAANHPFIPYEVDNPAYLPLSWHALPEQGVNSPILTMAALGDEILIGGWFTETVKGTTTNLGHIARFDTKAEAWKALSSNGVDDTVRALAFHGSDLYVGGEFTKTGDSVWTELGFIACYDTDKDEWLPLPHRGLNHYVYAMAVAGNDLYVGGSFTQTGDGSLKELGRIVRYDMENKTWHALPNKGLNGNVNMLVVSGSDLYVGGGFTSSGDGAAADLNHIARYDTVSEEWYPLANNGLIDDVETLVVSGSDLYVGGDFTQTADQTKKDLGYIARYDTTGSGSWHALSFQGLNLPVYSLALSESDLYVGGAFTQTGDGLVGDLNHIARFDTEAGTWHALPNQGLNWFWVHNFVSTAGAFYVSGMFSETGDGLITDLGNIGRLALDVPEFSGYLPLVVKP